MRNREKLAFIEAITDRDDIPQLLEDVANALKR